MTLPAKNIAQPTVVGWNGEAFANFSINLPKYYKSLNLYDKTGKIDPKYPLPVKTTVSSVSNDTVQPEANVIAELTLTQRADGSFTPRKIYSGIDSSVRYPPFLRRTFLILVLEVSLPISNNQWTCLLSFNQPQSHRKLCEHKWLKSRRQQASRKGTRFP